MRASIFAALLIAAFVVPAAAAPRLVQGAVNGTTTATKGVAYGAGQAVARGTVTAARGIGYGAVCVFTVGARC